MAIATLFSITTVVRATLVGGLHLQNQERALIPNQGVAIMLFLVTRAFIRGISARQYRITLGLFLLLQILHSSYSSPQLVFTASAAPRGFNEQGEMVHPHP